MALPEQIRKQTEAVQELYTQLAGGDEQGEQQNAPAQGNAGNNDGEQTPDVNVDAQSGNEEATQPAGNEQTPAGTEPKSKETIAQKYRTLQGMYNAEVPRLHQQVRETTAQVQRLQELLATLTTQQAQSPTAPQASPAQRLVTDEDVEVYGDSLEVMRKVTREEVVPMIQRMAQLERAIQQMQSSMVPQVETLARNQAVSTEQQFWTQLNAAVPNWKQINDNPDFQTWLLNVDPLTGIARQTILEDAQRTHNVGRVISFFKVWSEENGLADVAQNSQRESSATELQKQVAPGRSRSTNSAAAAAAAGKRYTPSDISAFFNAVRTGKYKGREAERDRIERDIFAAQREGRIVEHA